MKTKRKLLTQIMRWKIAFSYLIGCSYSLEFIHSQNWWKQSESTLYSHKQMRWTKSNAEHIHVLFSWYFFVRIPHNCNRHLLVCQHTAQKKEKFLFECSTKSSSEKSEANVIIFISLDRHEKYRKFIYSRFEMKEFNQMSAWNDRENEIENTRKHKKFEQSHSKHKWFKLW